MSLSIPEKERGKLHVFALNIEPDEGPEEGPDQRPAAILGVATLDPDYAEIVRLNDLEAMSLTDYLREGYDVSEEVLSPARAKLNAVEGYVLIVLSLAFRDEPHELQLGSDLTHLASLATEGPDWTPAAPDAPVDMEPTPKRPSDAAMMGRVASVVLLLMFALTALVIWVGG